MGIEVKILPVGIYAMKCNERSKEMGRKPMCLEKDYQFFCTPYSMIDLSILNLQTKI